MSSPDDLIADYYKQTQVLVEVLLSNKNFSGHVVGMAFDNTPVCFSLGTTTDDASLEQQFASAPRPTGKQTAIYMHDRSIVLVDQTIEYKESHPLVFYLRDGPRPGAFNVWMSSHTRNLILVEDYGIDLTSAVSTMQDDNNVPKFHLMPEALKKELAKRALDKLLLVNPLVDVELCLENPNLAFNYGRDISEVNDYLRSVFSVKMIPGVVVSDWPQKALSWTSRQKKWPQNEVINGVLKCPVVVIPLGKEDLWTLDFSTAEKCLLGHVDAEKMKILLDVQVLLYQMSDPNISWHKLLKQAFLWFLEQGGENFIAFLELFKKYLKEGFLPLYFYAEVNMLDEIMEEEVDEMLTTVEAALMMDDTQREIHLQNYSSANVNDIFPGLSQHLQKCFERQISLLYLQLCHQLHLGDLDKSIAMHMGMIKRIEESSVSDDITVPLLKLITNSLGSLYMVKAGHIEAKQSKQEMGIRAQELLTQSMDMDLLSGRAKLAMFHFYKKEFAEVVELLKEFPLSTCTSNNLWSKWKAKQCSLDVIISDHERPFLPSSVRACCGLMASQVLGYVRCNVAIINNSLFCRYLKIMSLIALDKASAKADVREDLELMLATAEDDEADMNEKRNVAYLNILADVYNALDDDRVAEGLLQKSVTLMANPRNPARWKLLMLKTRKARKMLTWGAAGFMLSTLAAVAIKLTRANVQGSLSNLP